MYLCLNTLEIVIFLFIDMLAPLITRIINKSLEKGCVPDDLKHANILPLIKKDNLDKDILKNYRPVSNLTFVSKLLEKVVAERLKNHLDKYDLWSIMQSVALFTVLRLHYSECKMTLSTLLVRRILRHWCCWI